MYRAKSFSRSISDVFGRSTWVIGCLLAVFQSGCSGGEPVAQLPNEDQVTFVNQTATLAPVTESDWPQIRGIGGAGRSAGESVDERGLRKFGRRKWGPVSQVRFCLDSTCSSSIAAAEGARQ